MITAWGEGVAAQVAKQVNFEKEKVVRMDCSSSGPPFKTINSAVRGEDKLVVHLFIDTPEAKVRLKAFRRSVAFYAVPANAQLRFDAPLAPETAWGKGIDGVQYGVESKEKRNAYRIGESVTFVLKARNVSAEPTTFEQVEITDTSSGAKNEDRHGLVWQTPLRYFEGRAGTPQDGWRGEGVVHLDVGGKFTKVTIELKEIGPFLIPQSPSPGGEAVLKQAAVKVQTLRGGHALFDEEAVYFVNPEAGIEAVNLKTGKSLWKTEKGSYWPLALADRRLVTREPNPKHANVIHIAILDLDQKGKLVKKSQPVELPAGATFDWQTPHHRLVGGGKPRDEVRLPSPTARFETRIEDGKLLITWEAPIRNSEGETETRSGATEVDLNSGAVRVVPGDKKLLAEQKAPPTIVIGKRTFDIIDITTQTGKGASMTTVTVPTLRAIDTVSGKIAWTRTLRGGLTTTGNRFAP